MFRVKVLKAIKKIAALGVGMSMVGATMLGAMAADLSNYPNQFVKNGQFDGIIVVGDKAAAEDVVGSIDIATSLQFALGQPVSQPTQPGGQGGVVSVSGDAVSISEPNDLLEIQEKLGAVKEVLTEFDLAGLQGGTVVTDEGSTDYNQYLRFETVTDRTDTNNYVESGSVVFEEDEEDVVGDYLKFVDGNFMFQYELEFEEGAESEIETRNSVKILKDLEDEEINILGKVFSIVNTKIVTDNADPSVTLELLGGDVLDTLEEGETRTYTIDGKEYEVTLVIVSDTRESAKFSVNGEITDELKDGDTDVLRDGTEVGIRDLLPNEAEEETGGDIVEFFLGANKVKLQDTNYSDDTFVAGGVEVHEEDIEDARIKLKGVVLDSNNTYELQTLQYKLKADSPRGDVYVAPGHGIREYLDEPEGMLSDDWDVRYEGLMDTGVSIIRFSSEGDDAYNLQFTNREGLEYDVPFFDNSGDTVASNPKYGDDDDDLVFIEGNVNSTNVGHANASQNGEVPTTAPVLFDIDQNRVTGSPAIPGADMCGNWFNIDEGDYFVLTDQGGVSFAAGDETSFTHILTYESIDTSNRKLTFQDDATGQRQVSYVTTGLPNNCVLGKASTLIVGGNTYDVYISTGTNQSGNANKSKYPLAIDQNSDDRVDVQLVDIVVNGGGILRIGGVNTTEIHNTSAKRIGSPTAGVQGRPGIAGEGDQGWSFPFSSGQSPSQGTLLYDQLNNFLNTTRDYNGSKDGETYFRINNGTGATGNFTVSLKTLASEFDGNGVLDTGDAETVIVTMFANSGNTVDLKTPSRQNSTDSQNKTINGGEIFLLNMETLDEEDLIQGLTTYGVFFEQTDESSTNDANDLTIEYPLSQRGADVFITIGSTQTTRVGPTQGGAVVVNPITVGSAKLSSEIAGQETSQNIIAVGGPCINSVAAKWMGSDSPLCGAESGLQEGSAVVKLFEHDGGKVGMLVAGWSAADTRRATKVVAEYADYADKLAGMEVVVEPGTATGEIRVSAAKP